MSTSQLDPDRTHRAVDERHGLDLEGESTMQRRTVIKSAMAVATALAVEGCGSHETTTSSSSPAASNAGQPGWGGAPAGQQFTAVNLNTNGDSPGGANTAEVAAAATAF